MRLQGQTQLSDQAYTPKFPLEKCLPVLTWDSRASFHRAKTLGAPGSHPHFLDDGNRVLSLLGLSGKFGGRELPVGGEWGHSSLQTAVPWAVSLPEVN